MTVKKSLQHILDTIFNRRESAVFSRQKLLAFFHLLKYVYK